MIVRLSTRHFLNNYIVGTVSSKKEGQSCAIQAGYKENAPGIMVFSICVDSAEQDTVGQKIL